MKYSLLLFLLLSTSCRKERYLIPVIANVSFTATKQVYSYFGDLYAIPIKLDRVTMNGQKAVLNEWNYVKPGDYTIVGYSGGKICTFRVELKKSEYKTINLGDWK